MVVVGWVSSVGLVADVVDLDVVVGLEVDVVEGIVGLGVVDTSAKTHLTSLVLVVGQGDWRPYWEKWEPAVPNTTEQDECGTHGRSSYSGDAGT